MFLWHPGQVCCVAGRKGGLRRCERTPSRRAPSLPPRRRIDASVAAARSAPRAYCVDAVDNPLTARTMGQRSRFSNALRGISVHAKHPNWQRAKTRARQTTPADDHIGEMLVKARAAMASYAAEIAAHGPGAHRRGRDRAGLVDLQARERAPAGRDRRRGDRHRRGREQGHQEPAQDLRHAARPARVKSTGIIEEIPEKGIVKYAKPVGVVGAITPSTNPSATPVNKAMMALKGGNAIIIAPPPTAWAATQAHRRRHARGAREDRSAGGPRADPAEPRDARGHHAADGAGRSGRRHRQPGQRAPGLQVRQAGARRRPRQRAGDHRCLGRSRRRRPQDHAVQDLRPCHVVLVGERGGDRRRGLRQGHRRAREGGRLPGDRGGAQAHRRAAVAGRQAQPRRHRAGPAGADRRLRAGRRSPRAASS